MKNFRELLNKHVDNITVSKNTMIKATGVDRSTFFQILSGKRIPTAEQFENIIEQLEIATVEKMELREAYKRAKV